MKFENVFLIFVFCFIIFAFIFAIINLNRIAEERIIMQGMTIDCITNDYCRELTINLMEEMNFDKRQDERKDMYDLVIRWEEKGK